MVDNPSVLMPAPPAASRRPPRRSSSTASRPRHALTTAMVDLAARGELREAAASASGKLSIDVLTPDENDPRVMRNRRVPTGAAEAFALEKLQGIADAKGHIAPSDLPGFSKHEEGFADRLEQHVADQGWFQGAARALFTDRWTSRSAWVLVLGVIGFIIAVVLPSQGLLLLGVAMIVASLGMFILARAMPQRTMQGAMVFAWLSAYQRTLAKTLEQSRTMDQVIASHAVPWLETPDQAVVWGYALGLHEEVKDDARSLRGGRGHPCGLRRLVPGVVRGTGRHRCGRLRVGPLGRVPLVRAARLRGHDRGTGHDRLPAGIVGIGWRVERRLRWWRVGRRRRRRRRRLLARTAGAGSRPRRMPRGPAHRPPTRDGAPS